MSELIVELATAVSSRAVGLLSPVIFLWVMVVLVGGLVKAGWTASGLAGKAILAVVGYLLVFSLLS